MASLLHASLAMTMNTMSPKVWSFLIFGIVGIFGEVIFTAFKDLVRTRRFRLHGCSFIWMIPIYGSIVYLFPPVHQAIQGYSWLVRGIIYMVIIYGIEYVSGTLLTKLTGDHIWNYRDRFNYKGQITLLYVPIWFAVGLAIEKYFPMVERLSRVLSRGV